MNAPVRYGQTGSEKQAIENEECRRAVKELENWGFSQRQLLLIIYLIAQELENTEHMRSITRLVRDLPGTNVFMIDPAEKDGGVADGSPDVQG